MHFIASFSNFKLGSVYNIIYNIYIIVQLLGTYICKGVLGLLIQPTLSIIDFTSSIENSVTAVIVLLSLSPFTLIGSSTINVPDVEVNVKDVALLAAAFNIIWSS